MSIETNWSKYYELTKEYPPTKLLLEALPYVIHKDKAIDIGGGALRNTRHLLQQGFDVTVIDKEPTPEESIKMLASHKLHPIVSTFANFKFPESEYDIVCAMFSLPFNPPDTFTEVFHRIKASLVRDGIFCGQFFGTRDEWSKNTQMTFHTKEQIESLLEGMNILSLTEDEKDGKIADGTPKHWHIFHCIAQKP